MKKKCLVLDLDETLVHSSFQYVENADYVIPIEIGPQIQRVFVLKRPGVDEFLARVGHLYEVVIFTASLPKYADPVIDLLDTNAVVQFRLFRESCVQLGPTYVKNLSYMGRPMNSIVIVDNSQQAYIMDIKNAIPIESWFDDPHDCELENLATLLEQMATVPDVVPFIAEKKLAGILRS